MLGCGSISIWIWGCHIDKQSSSELCYPRNETQYGNGRANKSAAKPTTVTVIGAAVVRPRKYGSNSPCLLRISSSLICWIKSQQEHQHDTQQSAAATATDRQTKQTAPLCNPCYCWIDRWMLRQPVFFLLRLPLHGLAGRLKRLRIAFLERDCRQHLQLDHAQKESFPPPGEMKTHHSCLLLVSSFSRITHALFLLNSILGCLFSFLLLPLTDTMDPGLQTRPKG